MPYCCDEMSLFHNAVSNPATTHAAISVTASFESVQGITGMV